MVSNGRLSNLRWDTISLLRWVVGHQSSDCRCFLMYSVYSRALLTSSQWFWSHARRSSTELSCLPPDPPEQNGQDDERPSHNLLGERRNTEQVEHIGEDANDHRADDRASDASLATEEAGATNDDDGNRVELDPRPSRRFAHGQTGDPD